MARIIGGLGFQAGVIVGMRAGHRLQHQRRVGDGALSGPLAVSASHADLRALLASPAKLDRGDDAYVRAALVEAAQAQAAGHGFDIAEALSFRTLVERTPPPEVLPMLGVPYAVTPIVVTTDGFVTLYVLFGDDEGRLRQILVAQLAELETTRRRLLAAAALVAFRCNDDGHARVTVPDQAALVVGYAWAGRALLMMLNDARLPVRREVAPERLNQSRLRRGKPPLAPLWRLDAALSHELYTTQLGPNRGQARDRGGHHRSPVAHDRRGHQRRLADGRTVWVRPTRVGELLRHLTRRRAFYALPDSQEVGQ